jgi:hypothetical protein
VSELPTVDPDVSRAKFAREIADYRSMEPVYRKRGWFLIEADFPEVFVLFASPKLKPPAIVAAVVLDFTDYDLKPPSVRFVDPFTRESLPMKDLRFLMMRRPEMPGATPETVAALIQQGQLPVSQLIQANGPEDRPFICLPGIREYHENPAHTGDSWLLHRGCGEGSLVFILEKIWAYGVNPIEHFQIQIQTQQVALAVPAGAIPA